MSKVASKKSGKKPASPIARYKHLCVRHINKLLGERNGRLFDSINLIQAPQRIFVAVEKKDTRSRVKPGLLACSYCPFCGRKMPSFLSFGFNFK